MSGLVAITLAEQNRLVELEKVVEGGLAQFLAVGSALAEIRDKRLYKAEFSRFEDYCREKWGIVQQTATRLIRASDTMAVLASEPIGSLPQAESQVRPLTKLNTPEQQQEAWKEAVQISNGKPTAKHVEAAVEKVIKARAEQPVDSSRIQPIKCDNVTPEKQARIDESEKELGTLWSLKSYWRKATKREKGEFRTWADHLNDAKPQVSDRFVFRPGAALQYASLSIMQLEKIDSRDTQRAEGLAKVAAWIRKQILEPRTTRPQKGSVKDSAEIQDHVDEVRAIIGRLATLRASQQFQAQAADMMAELAKEFQNLSDDQ